MNHPKGKSAKVNPFHVEWLKYQYIPPHKFTNIIKKSEIPRNTSKLYNLTF